MYELHVQDDFMELKTDIRDKNLEYLKKDEALYKFYQKFKSIIKNDYD